MQDPEASPQTFPAGASPRAGAAAMRTASRETVYSRAITPRAPAGDAVPLLPGNNGRLQRSILKVVHSACDAGQLGLALELLKICDALTLSEMDIRERRRMSARSNAAHLRLNALSGPGLS